MLLNDYWHPKASIEPALPDIFDDFDYIVSEDPESLLTESFDLFVNFKDGIEDTQVPTPNWYSAQISKRIRDLAYSGTGILCIHCGLANIPKDSPVYNDVLRGVFVAHPPVCPVTFTPFTGHPITRGVSEFQIEDEQYAVSMFPTQTNILGYTTSVHGTNPALWAHEAGKGRVCVVTPGHTTQVLTNPSYKKILSNAARWCAR